MTVEEKLRMEYPELAEYNHDELIASTARVNGEFKECQKTNCKECDFDFRNAFHNCYQTAEEWVNSEVNHEEESETLWNDFIQFMKDHNVDPRKLRTLFHRYYKEFIER